ncbi:MAG: hypothetical protein IJ822_02355, partial [Pyramidobacter sp.]|nr:hypothetical protein [Pyramidobacter sp.]
MEKPNVTNVEIGSPVVKPGVTTPRGGADFTITPANSIVPLSGGDLRGTYVKITVEGKSILRAYASFAFTAGEGKPFIITCNQILHNEHIDASQDERIFPRFADGLAPLAAANWADLTRSFYYALNYGPEGEDTAKAQAFSSVD